MKNYLKTTALIAAVMSGAAMYALTAVPTEKAHAPSRATNESPSGISAKFNAASASDGLTVGVRKASNGVRTVKSGQAFTQQDVLETPARVEGVTAELYGTLLYSSGLESGLYRIPTTDGASFELMTNATRPAKNGAVVLNRQYMYPVLLDGVNQMYTVDIDNWTLVGTPQASTDATASAAVYDPTTDCVYGYYYYDNDTEICFAIGHYPSGRITMIADNNKEPMAAIAVDANGQLYAINYKGILYKVDKTNGEKTQIGDTGVVSQYNTSGAIDPATGIFYFAKATDFGGWLYTIDTTNAKATLIQTFPSDEEIGGMFVKPADYAATAPGLPTDLALNFSNGESNGTITFKAPASSYNGAVLSGDVVYTVRANGKTLASARVAAGAEVTVPVSVAGGTNYTFAVFASNGSGEGPRARATEYIGKDVPSVPNVTASFLTEENAIFVKWDAIEVGAAGGFINPDEVTYTVTRVGDNTVIAENIKETSVKDTSFGSGSNFQYKVVATCGELSSEPGLSNVVDMTVKYPPYLETFDTKDPFDDEYTMIGSGKGDNKWTYYKSQQVVRAYYDFDYDKDEWLITPAIMLEGGKKYKFSFLSYGQKSYEEHMEVWYGSENTIAGMEKMLDNLVIKSADQITYEYTISPTETRKYYFGFHATSEYDMGYLYLDNIAVSAPTGDNVPDEATEVVLTPGEDGAKSATVSFKAPTQTITGQTITELEKIEIYRESNLVNTIDNPVPGESYSYVDNVPQSTNYTYYIYAYNEDGMGKAAKVTGYIGVKAPSVPTDAVLVENSTPGNVNLSWKAPTTYADGTPINLKYVTYQIKSGKNLIKGDLTETSFDFQAVNSNTQDFVSYEVIAVTEGGSSTETAQSNVLLVGVPAKAPYKESFRNGNNSNPLATVIESGYGNWRIYTDSSFAELDSQDGDNGYIGFSMYNGAGDSSSLLTGRYDLTGVTNTAFTFYVYPTGQLDENNNVVSVSVNDGSGWTKIKEVVFNTLFDQQKWNKVIVPLDAYDGQVIQLKLTSTNNQYFYSFYDNFVLEGINAHQLEPVAVNVPYIVNVGEDYDVTVYVGNNGIKTTGKYTVELIRNGEKVGEAEGDALKGGETAKFIFTERLETTSDRVNSYRAVVNYDNNTSSANNESADFITTVRMPYTPAVEDLDAVDSENGAVLSWTAPALDEARPAETTEDFESYEPWTFGTSLGDWTLVDRDKGLIGGPANYSFPNIPDLGKGRLSFFVLDSTWETIADIESYEPYSGTQYISNMYNYDWSQNDDWIISPELYGGHQIVKIYVKSFNPAYPEAVEVLYSTTDKDPESFIHAISMDPVPGDWTLIEAALPEGAKYFAVRAIGVDRFMLFCDDFTYVPAGSAETLSLTGYNVYRDGAKITEEPVKETTYVDGITDSETHSYYVTAVYEEKGESAGSNVVSLAHSGVNTVYNADFKVRVNGQNIIITGANGKVSVANAAGQVVYSADAQAVNTAEINAAGVYIVRDANNIRKVIVK